MLRSLVDRTPSVIGDFNPLFQMSVLTDLLITQAKRFTLGGFVLIDVYVPDEVTGRNLLSTWSQDADGNQFPVNIGTGPVSLGGKHSTIRRTSFHQGKEDLHGENSVFHKKREGEITIVSNKIIEVDRHSYTSLGDHYYLVNSIGTRSSIGGTLLARPSGTSSISWYRTAKAFESFAFIICDQSSYVYGIINQASHPSYSHNAILGGTRFNEDFSRTDGIPLSYPRGKAGNTSFSAYKSELLACANSALAALPPFSKGSMSGLKKYKNQVSTESVRRTILRHSGDFKIPPDADKEIDFGKLAQVAIRDMDAFSLNSLMYVQEMINIKSLLPPRDEIRNLRKLDPKAFANVYLWIRYGLSLSYRDTKLLVQKLPGFLKSSLEISKEKTRLRSRKTKTISYNGLEWKVNQGIKILLDTYPKNLGKVGAFVDTLYGLDALPTLQNIWDMIPYSFVVDWMIPVGDMLDTIDTKGRQQSFTVYAVTLSYKGTARETLKHTADTMTFGEINNIFYHRAVRTSIPSLGVFDSVRNEPSSSGGTKRFFDATSLILQKAL